MTIWVDAQLSPRTARWISENFPVGAFPLRDLGLRDSSDEDIFAAARVGDVVVLTKDSDFVRMLERNGSPPKIIWLTCGNTSEMALQKILTLHLATALLLLQGGEDLVEIGSP
jgi:predicted nuclease of predicted toxin-antitoxin system